MRSSLSNSKSFVADTPSKMLSYNDSRASKNRRGQTKFFAEKLWIMGKQVGTITGSFYLNNVPLLSQLSLGVMTERGLQMATATLV